MLRVVIACAFVLATRVAVAAPAFTAEVTGKGRPVLLIPGLGCPASVWTQTAAHLAARHEVHTLALAGFAGKPAIDRPLVAAIKDDAIRYIKEHKLDHPVVIGHSMGGFVALWIAEAAPDLVGPVVVVDASPTFGGGDPDIVPYATRKRDAYRTMSAPAFAAAIRERYEPMFSNPKKHAEIIEAVTRSDQKAFAGAFYELFTIDLRPKLPVIATPVLVILADAPRFEKLIREYMKPAKRHSIVVLPNTRHFVMHDDFAGFSKTLDTFLAAH